MMEDYVVIFRGGKTVSVRAYDCQTAAQDALKVLFHDWENDEFKNEQEAHECAVLNDATKEVFWLEVYWFYDEPTFTADECTEPHDDFPELENHLQEECS